MHGGEAIFVEIGTQLTILGGIDMQESGEPVLGLQNIEVDEVEERHLKGTDARGDVDRDETQNHQERDVADEPPEHCDESRSRILITGLTK